MTVWTLLLDWSYRYTNYAVVITIWLNVTKYAYLKWQCTFNFLSLPIPLPDLTVYIPDMSNTMVVLQETGTAYLLRAPVLSFLGCVVLCFCFFLFVFVLCPIYPMLPVYPDCLFFRFCVFTMTDSRPWQTGSRDRVCHGWIDQSYWIWRPTTGNYDSVRLKVIFTTIHKNN